MIYNFNIIDKMYEAKSGNDVAIASRFMKGGSMVGCPVVKSISKDFKSFFVYFFKYSS